MDEAAKTRIAELETEVSKAQEQINACDSAMLKAHNDLIKWSKIPIWGVVLVLAKQKKTKQKLKDLDAEMVAHRATIQRLQAEIAELRAS